MIDHDRLPPQNLEAERRVLGGMLLDNRAILDVAEVLAPGDFYRDSHAAMFRSILALHDAGEPVDALTLDERLRRDGRLEEAGGPDAIAEVLRATPHAADARYMAEVVRQKAVARAIVESAHETLREVASERYTADELAERLERRTFAIGRGRARREPVPVADLVREAMGRILDRCQGRADGGLMTGLLDLDALLGGFRPGNLVVLAARPSMGKTALALGIALHAAEVHGVGSLVVSLEMTREELAERLIGARSGVRSSKVQAPRFLTEGERRQLGDAVPLFDGVPLWVDDSGALNPTQLAATARRSAARHGLGLVVVDYLQLVTPDDPKTPRHEQVAATSRRLKALAKELAAPVLALAQLNRQTEQREDRRPRLADLRESGQIEQDADAVILIHRPEYYDPSDRPGVAELIVAKNRNGPTAKVDVVFERELMRFTDLEARLEPAF